MSRLASLSPAALQAMFSQETDNDLITLLTVYDPVDGTTPILRLADGFTTRLEETETSLVYGVVSRGSNFVFLPFQATLPAEIEANAPSCNITVNDVTQYIIPVIRELSAPPKVLIELVLRNSPSTVEVRYGNFYATNFTYTQESVTMNINMINYAIEPFPQYSFTPQYFPELF